MYVYLYVFTYNNKYRKLPNQLNKDRDIPYEINHIFYIQLALLVYLPTSHPLNEHVQDKTHLTKSDYTKKFFSIILTLCLVPIKHCQVIQLKTQPAYKI